MCAATLWKEHTELSKWLCGCVTVFSVLIGQWEQAQSLLS